MRVSVFLSFVLLFVPITIFSQTATAPAAGDGSAGNPYQIATLNNLYWIAATDAVVASPNRATRWANYYIQTADIDASATSTWDDGNGGAAEGWPPIGNSTTKFTGNYNGQYFSIDNLFISRSGTDYQGFFGYTNGATIQNLGLENIYIRCNLYGGGLSGRSNATTISNCYADVDIDGASTLGGLVGRNEGAGTIQKSYAIGSLIGGNRLGGLVGTQGSGANITNCYSSVAVTGKAAQNIYGGLVGENLGTITKSYTNGVMTVNLSDAGGLVGRHGTATNCFWDINSTGLSTSAGGTSKTTAQMKTQSTFTNAGWDFIVETTNGTNDYWEMNSAFNNGYPILSWQSVEVTGITTTPNIVSGSNIGFIAQSGSVSLNFVEMYLTPANLPSGARAINKYWEMGEVTGGNVKLRLYYFPSLTVSFTGTPKIMHYNGSSWEVLPTEPEVTVGSLKYVETTNYYSSFSPVTIGDDDSPLPVELTTFTAKLADNKVNLTWQTATEINNYGFQVERSISEDQNEAVWVNIGFVNGHGNSNTEKRYQFTDAAPLSGKNIYRLKQIDTDGSYEYSSAVEVEFNSAAIEYFLGQNFPNPFNPETRIHFSIPSVQHVVIKLYDITGKEKTELLNKTLPPGAHSIMFDGAGLPSGVYIYRMTAGVYSSVKKLTLMK